MPKFSIIIPTYNSEENIEKCLTSVIEQSFTDYEIIIVDDFSTDNTREIIKQIKKQNNNLRISTYTNNKNMGVSYTRNIAISKAKGEYIVILDSDDYFINSRLEVINDYISSSASIDVIFDNLLYLQDGKDFFHTNAYLKNNIKIDKIKSINVESFIDHDLGYLKGTIRKEILVDNQIVYNTNINTGEDFLFYIECFMNNANVCLIPEALYVYRQRQDSLSHTINMDSFLHRITSTQSILEKYKFDSKIDIKTKSLILERLERQKKSYQYFEFSNSIKEKKYKKAVSLVIDNPRLLKLIWKRIKSI